MTPPRAGTWDASRCPDRARVADVADAPRGVELRAVGAYRHFDDNYAQIWRDLAVTLRRSYGSVPWYKRLYLMSGLLLGVLSSDEIDEEAIEKLKQGDILESTFTEFAEFSPELYEALIAERDRYMAARLRKENAGRAGGEGNGRRRQEHHAEAPLADPL